MNRSGLELGKYVGRALTRFVSSINEVNQEAKALDALRLELEDLKRQVAALEAK